MLTACNVMLTLANVVLACNVLLTLVRVELSCNVVLTLVTVELTNTGEVNVNMQCCVDTAES